MLSLGLLGSFEAQIGQLMLAALPKKSQALMAYLAIEGAAPHSRTELATLLWGDTGDEQALQSLRKALSVIRQALDQEADALLIVQDGAIALNHAAVTVDALEFERLARAGDAESLRSAATMYRGHLLAGLDLDEGPFNEWLLSRRERLRELALSTLGKLLDMQMRTGADDAAIETGQRILALEPLHEATHRSLIQIYGRLGRRAAAARQYQICVDALARELGVTPDPSTNAAYRESLAGRFPDPLADLVSDSSLDVPRVPAAPRVPDAPPAVPTGAVTAKDGPGWVIRAAIAVALVAAVTAIGWCGFDGRAGQSAARATPSRSDGAR